MCSYSYLRSEMRLVYDANFLFRVDADFQLIISEAPSQCVNGKCTPPPGPCDPACGEFM
jgi:hypothetical protein